MNEKLTTLLKFLTFIALLNLLIGFAILLGADIGEKKLIMFERTVNSEGNSVTTTPIYAYCANCTCKNK